MIYIDPPYNTGNDFIYPDNYSENLQTYLEYTGQVDSEGRKFSNNLDSDGRFHSRWMNMMYPRLYLARNLLQEEGFIFVSIDDHEVDNLRKLLSEILGEENFIGNAVWEKSYTANMTAQFISDTHDHVLIYTKSAQSASLGRFERTEEQKNKFKNPDDDSRGPWKSENLSAGKFYSAGQFKIIGPTGEEFLPPPGRYWRCNETQYKKWLADGRITFGKSNDGRPMLKKFLSEVEEGLTPSTWWEHELFGTNKEASLELKELFGGAAVFETPKPLKLLRKIVSLAGDDESIVLDFFAGSGVTAQAVLDLNNEDGGNRKFILVQLPEQAGREDFKTIADITKERVRRVIQRHEKEAEGKLDLGNRPKEGFRVLKLATSNFKIWNAATETTTPDALAKQLELQINHIQQERTSEDLLYEILLKTGFPPTTPIETLTVEGKTVYSVTGYGMLICLERQLTHEMIKAIAERKPNHVVCLDEGFAGNDQLKTNAVLIMKSKGVTKFQTI
jgi:adenine-specific DNA-methyltransferase